MTPAVWLVIMAALVVLACMAAGEAAAWHDHQHAMRAKARRLKQAELERDSDYYGRTPR